MEDGVASARVLVAPESFDFAKLFEEASLLDTDDYDELAGGLKRPRSPSSDSDASPNAERALPGHVSIEANRTEAPSGTAQASTAQSRKSQRRNKKRKHLKEVNGHSVPPGVAEKYVKEGPLRDVEVRYVDLDVSSCGYHGRKETKEAQKLAEEEDCSVEALLESGCTVLPWDGITPEAIVEKGTGRIILVLAGRPNDPLYIESMLQATDTMLKAGEAANFTSEECNHRRADDSAALNVGMYHGGGTKGPCNLCNGRHSGMLEELVANPDVSRMAAFADAAFKLWSPRVYDDVRETINKLCDRDPKLKKNWSTHAYPCAAFNFGPRVRCKCHKDCGNSPKTLCAIQALGRFDATKGGHLYIRELRLLIQFPAGATILIPSALLTHGNTPVGDDETRLSFTQFVPGGLFRYVDNGFKTERQLAKKSKAAYQKKMKEKAGRWERDMKLVPTLSELRKVHGSGAKGASNPAGKLDSM